jgi:membrane-associated phospholipid phosphatase
MMLAGIRERIGKRLFRGQVTGTGTAVEPFVIRRGTWLFVVVVSVLLWSVALLLWAQGDIDRQILFRHNAWRAHATVIGIFRPVSAYGMAFIVFVLLSHLVLSARIREPHGTQTICLLIIFSFAIGGITGDLLKYVFDRARPFIEYADQITAISRPASPSLPSGHATKSMALALPFVVFVANGCWPSRLVKGVVLLTALAVGYARIVLGAHFLSDVLAGMGVAVACLPLAVMAANRILRRVTQEKLPARVKVWGGILFLLMLYLLKLS